MRLTHLGNFVTDDILSDLVNEGALSPRTCREPTCKRSFVPVRKWQEFCSNNCRNTFHRFKDARELADLRKQLEQFKRGGGGE